MRHYNWNSTHFYPDIHHVDTSFKKRNRNWQADLAWLDLPEEHPPHRTDPGPAPAKQEMLERKNINETSWEHSKEEMGVATENGQFRRFTEYDSSDEENHPPPQRMQPSQVVAMAREAAKQRSRSVDDYLHVPGNSDSDADSVASSPKVPSFISSYCVIPYILNT